MPKPNSFLFLGKVGRVEWSWSFCHSQPLPDPPGCGKWIWHQNTKYWWQDPPASATWNIWTSHKFFPVDKWGMNNFYGLGVIPGIRTCYVGFLNFFILWAWFNQGVRGLFLVLLPSQTPSALLISAPGQVLLRYSSRLLFRMDFSQPKSLFLFCDSFSQAVFSEWGLTNNSISIVTRAAD